jgi:hypothetical protein
MVASLKKLLSKRGAPAQVASLKTVLSKRGRPAQVDSFKHNVLPMSIIMNRAYTNPAERFDTDSQALQSDYDV